MLGPFLHAPPPADGKGKKVAWVVAWLALGMGFVMTLLSVVLHCFVDRGPSPNTGLRRSGSLPSKIPAPS